VWAVVNGKVGFVIVDRAGKGKGKMFDIDDLF
jgi:hypothetical protein